jgi:two-component system sensor histidine kinase TctE
VVIAGDPDLPAAAAQPANPAHESVSFRGKSVRLATYRTRTRAGTVLVTVAETLNKRLRIQERLWSTALWTDVAELAAVLALVWLGVRLALKPLDDLGERIARQSPRDLQPIATGNTPLELVGVLQRLNVLLATVAEISQAERRFIESAAHQLRTPLAGLLAQLELLAGERSLADAHQQAQLALAAAQRLTHTTQQLLTLSRAEHGAHLQGQTPPVDLVALATASVSSHLASAQAAGLDLGAELEPVTIDGVGWLLSEALDNLIGNALTYTQRGAVTVRMGVRDAVPFLEVVDSGIGIPPAERAKVLSRFYRGEGSRGVGSGLGLAIVQEVAEQHGATLTISEGLAGLGTCVRLDFPRPNPST